MLTKVGYPMIKADECGIHFSPRYVHVPVLLTMQHVISTNNPTGREGEEENHGHVWGQGAEACRGPADRARPSWREGKAFDRRRYLGMKMDHTRDSTDIVPKGQYMVGIQKTIYLHLQNSLVLHFCNCRRFPSSWLEVITTNTKWMLALWMDMLVCLLGDWSNTLVQTTDAPIWTFRADNNNR